MNPSERFFAKLRKLTVCLETESNNLLHASQNPQDDDENGAQALYQLHSEVRALKVCACLVMAHDFTLFKYGLHFTQNHVQRQVQDQVATHDATSTELKKHNEKYGYRPRNMNGRKEAEEQAERDAAEEDEVMGQGICEEAQQSETPEKMQPPVDQLRTPKLSDFGLSALQFQRVLGEAEPPHIAAPVPAVALSPPSFVMNMQPKTPKCSLHMEEDALTPRLEDFGISEYTVCWNNDFTMDLFNKKPPKTSKYAAYYIWVRISHHNEIIIFETHSFDSVCNLTDLRMKSILHSPRLHLFDQRYSENSEFILIYEFFPVMAKLNFQQALF
uniref:Spindle and kinetochore-associated protein 3-like n=1 Tax=Sinocyclocheilus grahami TaxID=75366 RepID=A0A672KFS5_SINGR